MANTVNNSKSILQFEFDLSHQDIVSMMDDTNVHLDTGYNKNGQPFQVIIRKSNGNEILLREMAPTDTLVLRYTRVSSNTGNINYTGVDVQA